MPLLALLGSGLLVLGRMLGGALERGWIVLPPCPFKALTGWPCATCGLTRWGLALARGDWRGALHWHPAASLLLAAFPLVALWDLRRALRGDPYPPLPEAPWARWAFLAGLGLAWGLQAARGI